jgi:hypothetical protein
VGLRAGLDAEVRRKILYLCRGSNPATLKCFHCVIVHKVTLVRSNVPSAGMKGMTLSINVCQTFIIKRISYIKEESYGLMESAPVSDSVSIQFESRLGYQLPRALYCSSSIPPRK